MKCFFCPNPAAHPSTGCQYSESVLACAQCVQDFWSWFRDAQAKRSRTGYDRRGRLMADFYQAAGTNNPRSVA